MLEKTIVRVAGGLGNQLFSYAAGMFLQETLGHHVMFCFKSDSVIPRRKRPPAIASLNLPKLRESDCVLSGNPIVCSLLLFAKGRKRVFRHIETGYAGPLDHIQKGAIVEGHFQTHGYLSKLPNGLIPGGLELIREPSQWLTDLVSRAQEEKPIMVHIRRGDYAQAPGLWGMLNQDWYLNAIQIVQDRLGERPVWIFSDDKVLAAKFGSTFPSNQVSVIDAPPGVNEAEELVLMSSGFANIIANSSFSWWAASLSRSSKLTVAPTPWFKGAPSPNLILHQDWTPLPATWEGKAGLI